MAAWVSTHSNRSLTQPALPIIPTLHTTSWSPQVVTPKPDTLPVLCPLCTRVTSAAGSTSTSDQIIHKPSLSASRGQGAKQKHRLDDYCQRLFPHYSKNIIQSFILQGKVLVKGKVVDKAGHKVTEGCEVVVNAEQPKYVCRAGFKLEKALQHFCIDVSNKVALDSGQSTGGFTDCLLQHGAKQVIGIDVGHGQVAGSIRQDPRVTVMEKFNLRNLQLSDLPCQVDIATLDLSFISVLKVIPAVVAVMKPEHAELVVLIKPQFEAGKEQVQAGGLVKDPKGIGFPCTGTLTGTVTMQVHQQVIQTVTEGIEQLGFACQGVTESPIKGDKSGNTEFLAYFIRQQVQQQHHVPVP